MAEQEEVNAPAPERWYLSSVPPPSGHISGRGLQRNPARHSLYQIRVNPANPEQAALLPAPGAEGRLLNSFSDSVLPVFTTTKLPGVDDRFFTVEKPTMLEKVGNDWKIVEQGRVGFSATEPIEQVQVFGNNSPQVAHPAALTTPAKELASEVATTVGATRPGPELAGVATSGPQGPTTSPASFARAGALHDDARAEVKAGAGTNAPEKLKQPVIGEGLAGEWPPIVAAPMADPASGAVGELRITWQQKGDEVAPLLEMRAYLDQLREAGVAVGALTLAHDPAGKLGGSFGVSYDPDSPKLGQLEAALQGFRQVGHGVAVVEKPEQAAARRQEAGYDDGYEPPRSKQVKEAFGVRQWDVLSAQLSAVPKHALTGPEQVQQAAAEQRVQQLAQQQGKTTEQIIRDGKSILDIDTSGNPASAFLKNFYAHLNGGPKTRQNLEVDYEKTRQHLQARLTKHAGTAPAQSDAAPTVRVEGPAIPLATPAATPAASAVTAEVAKAAQAPPALAFQANEVPQRVLAALGVTNEQLAANGQLQKLLSGQKTDLMAMQVAGPAELGLVLNQSHIRMAARVTNAR